MLALVGPALTVERGLIPAALGLLVAVAIGHGRARRSAELGDVDDLPILLRRIGAAVLLIAAGVFAVVAARILAAVVIAFPAALWVLGFGLVIALAGPWLGGLGRKGGLLLLLGVVAVPLLTGAGLRFEADAADARGGATSGPILGIHPFQTTAIVIDGYGPFDLPFNDYVEPDGERGYGPVEYADAFERALHQIAEVHFAEGPARAYQAFAGATVEALEVPAVVERLDRPVPPGDEPRIRITSGTTGQRSRVELVCPGTRGDPRGLQPDTVMERMCPDRYAAEGSAGLGLTGRWTGYTERRGNERLGLSQALGWVRSDDLQGWRTTLKEERTVAFALVVLALLGLGGSISRRPGQGERGRRRASAALSAWGAAVVAVAGLIAALMMLAAGPTPVVGLWERPAAGTDLLSLGPWLPALFVGSALWELPTLFSGPRDQRQRPSAGVGRLLAALGIGLGTLAAASWVASAAWLQPSLWHQRGLGMGANTHLLAMERWILEVGELLHQSLGWDIASAESAVAGALVAAMVGLLAAISEIFLPLSRRLAPGLGRLAPLVPIGIAASLVVSKQTHGGALLLAPALLLTALVVAAFIVPRGRGRRPWGSAAVLVITGLLALWSLIDAWRTTTKGGPFLDACVVLGGAMTVAVMIAAWARPRQSRA